MARQPSATRFTADLSKLHIGPGTAPAMTFASLTPAVVRTAPTSAPRI